MKKLILFITMFLVGNLWVNAASSTESFSVGDSVEVEIIKGDVKGFHVLRASASGEQYVELIYDGILVGGVVYSDINSSTTFDENNNVYKRMHEEIDKEGAKWRYESASILSQSDIENLGITKNNSGIYEIPSKYKFLSANKLDSSLITAEMYNYWTSIPGDGNSVYCVTYNENKTSENDPVSTLVANDITNGKCGIRPVVAVDKKYVTCKNGTSIVTTTNVNSPNTGEMDVIVPLVSVITFSAIIFMLIKKKNNFNRI